MSAWLRSRGKWRAAANEAFFFLKRIQMEHEVMVAQAVDMLITVEM